MTFRQRTRAVCFGLIGLLYILSVPWYREIEAPLRLWLGLPDWVAVALLCYVGVAIFNAVAWSMSDLSDTYDSSDGSDTANAEGPTEVRESTDVVHPTAEPRLPGSSP
jgi:hypothetical protein